MLGVVSRVLAILQVRLAEKPHGSLLERLVGAAQAVAVRRRAAEEEAAKAAQRPNGHDATAVRQNCAA